MSIHWRMRCLLCFLSLANRAVKQGQQYLKTRRKEGLRVTTLPSKAGEVRSHKMEQSRDLKPNLFICDQLQFEIEFIPTIIKSFLGMSWTEQNSFFTFYYPFYHSHMPLHPYQPATIARPSFLPQKDTEVPYSSKIIRGLDTQAQLPNERAEAWESPELKRKAIRKQRILKRREREDNFERKKQKKDRNLPSNIFKYFTGYLYNHPNLPAILAGASEAPLGFSPSSFVGKLKEIIKQTQSYIRPAVIQQLCYSCLLSQEQTLAFRRVLKRFLLLQLSVLVGPMQKYKKRQRRELINLGRKLFEQIKASAF